MNALLTLGCAVCGAGEDAARGSYIGMTLIISIAPLLMLGGIAYFVVKAAKAENAAAEAKKREQTDVRA
ncbi:MAG: hypothetical protein QM817_26070 [Archangium sp.]